MTNLTVNLVRAADLSFGADDGSREWTVDLKIFKYKLR
ncbi:hypothetical protein M7I_1387 [Glarea lozoyensis 74030]|uniref:Uncharacterized protein n=1 Tax=Glarea lozoyensis (strain ATCC 74030 / MF5533) TaxID=1104152 RepID=H0EFX9_GLAL7|nr:hypothetical protein M7I_1387 [Glarea lozoyensis 74030]